MSYFLPVSFWLTWARQPFQAHLIEHMGENVTSSKLLVTSQAVFAAEEER